MMQRLQVRLAIALLFGGLFVLGFVGTSLISGPIGFLYRNAAGLSTARSIAQIAAILAAIGLFVTVSVVAVPLAFQPAGRLGKVLDVLPIYFLGFTLFGIVASLLGIGTTGALLNLGMAQITLTSAAIIVGIVLSTVAITIATARVPIAGRILNVAAPVMGVAAVASAVAAAALIISVVIVNTTKANTSFGPPDGRQSSSQSAPGASGTQAVQGPSSGADQADGAAGQGTQTAQGPAPAAGGSNQASDNGPSGQGGPGGGPTGFVGTFTVGGVLTAVFALIALLSTVGGLLALRGATSGTDSAAMQPINYRGQAGSTIAAVMAISFVLFVVIQFVPVSRDNPPVQTTVKWDSAQTQQLWTSTCADCHSNTTVWPWYSYIAPSSWLQSVHVTDARGQFNISELNNIPSFRKSMLPDEVEQQVTSGNMPPSDYLLLHPDARLSAVQKQQLIDGLKTTLASS